MEKSYWFLIILSAILYTVSFIFSDFLWWIIFIFPVPLLYAACVHNLSFIHGYVWGIIIFLLHLHAGIIIVADLARDSWWIGFAIGMGMVLYQALVPALLFWLAAKSVNFFPMCAPLMRLSLYTAALAFFTFLIDRYCLWIFGMHGYPFMHPLLPLAKHPSLLWALPIFGKQLLTIFFLLVPVGFVLLLWYKNFVSVLLCTILLMPWLWCGMRQPCQNKEPVWYTQIKSLPCMIRAHTASGAMHILTQHIKKLIASFPEALVVIMPESALEKIDLEMAYKLHEAYLGKPVHVICGACCSENERYYNSLYWTHNGAVQARFDKKYTMLLTESVAHWMNASWLRKIYFKDNVAMTQSCNERMPFIVSESIIFIPYICSELFFNEYPDDCYPDTPIVGIVNDTLLIGTYMQQLLLLLARFKAIQWQREIVYVSYSSSLFIDKEGGVIEIND